MGMLDEVRAINICHNNFDQRHNGLIYQSKSLGCEGSLYCIFNGTLYQEADNSAEFTQHDYAVKVPYSGELNIYTYIEQDNIEYWVDYDLFFESGTLIDVVALGVHITNDNRDLSALRPHKPGNRVEVTISVSGCDSEKTAAFVSSLDDSKLMAIRQILGEPTATIFYPEQLTYDSGFGIAGSVRTATVASVVQTKEDFESAGNQFAKFTAPNGDKLIVPVDEFHNFNNVQK